VSVFSSLPNKLRELSNAAQPTADRLRGVDPSIACTTPMLLEKVARQTARRGRHVCHLSARKLHSYRKALGRLSDDAGSFIRTFPGVDVVAYRARCVALQEILGATNDATVKGRLITELASASNAGSADPAKALADRDKRRRRLSLKGIRKAHSQSARHERFWIAQHRPAHTAR
jgi:CHAD domain-containing protein